jgi:poly(ADP-ribose) glycohydrolase
MWGCGVFNGDPELKAIIQLMACALSRRDLVFFTFGDVALEKLLLAVHRRLVDNGVSVGAAWPAAALPD